MSASGQQMGDAIPEWFHHMQNGVQAGVWIKPINGFRWREHLTPGLRTAEPCLVPNEAGWQRYALLRQKSVLSAFQRTAERPSKDAILGFANRFGPLDQLGPLRHVDDDPGAPVREWGEPLSVWEHELGAFLELRRTWDHAEVLQQDMWGPGRQREAREYLRQRIQWRDDGSLLYDSGQAGSDVPTTAPIPEAVREVIRRFEAGDIAEPARLCVRQEVSRRLRKRVHPFLLPNNELRFFPDSLISAIYLLLALELSGRSGNQRECQACGRVFFAGRSDQRFCEKACRDRAGYHNRRKGG
jgi:hypothetical protein